MSPTPEERATTFANVFALQAKAHSSESWRDAEEEANQVFARVENILVKELPRVADMMGGVVRGLEERIQLAHAEIETLRAQNAELLAKLAAVEELKKAVAKL